uniref:Uncharacterized protein n=1 Tax=Aegilops tauschii subsp. strangulata TaxID=200361 RepID=A0A453FBE6_AEGTS
MANMSILISTFGQRPRDQTSLPLVQYYFLPNVAMVIKMRMKDHPCASLYRVPGYLMPSGMFSSQACHVLHVCCLAASQFLCCPAICS